MKALLMCGSRNPEGQTAQAAGAVMKGLANGGAETEDVFLPALTLERCRQCDPDGWGLCRREGRCIVDDDLESLVRKVEQADIIVMATPVYFSDLSESLRAFTDRLRRTCIQEEGRKRIAGKCVAGVCVAGGGGGGAPECCASLGKVLTTCGFEVADLIPVRRQNLQPKLRPLELAGEWLAGQSCSNA